MKYEIFFLGQGNLLLGKVTKEVIFRGIQLLFFVHPISPHFSDSSKHCLKFYISVPIFTHKGACKIAERVWLGKAQHDLEVRDCTWRAIKSYAGREDK